MWRQLKRNWYDLKDAPSGERFTRLYESNRGRRSALGTWLAPLLAVVCVAIGVVLAFIPGPAILFFALAAGLIAMRSRWLARRLDRAELTVRNLVQSLRHRRGC